MKILVTGGAGFLGSHLCKRLIKDNHHVVCVDNFLTGKRQNLEEIEQEIDIIQCDVNNFFDLRQIFQKYCFDKVFHYAALVGVKRTLENPIAVLNDIDGVQNILALSHEFKVDKVVFSSSSEVYGEPVEIPEVESGHVNAKLPYSVSKLMGEKYLEAYYQQHGLKTCSLRFFNVYGPKQEGSDYGFVVGIFIKQILRGDGPTIFGDGTQTRDFVYVEDNIEAAVHAMMNDAVNGECINIGTGRPTTILDLAEDIIKLCNMEGKVKLQFVKNPRPDVRHRFPDITKMRTLLKFRPKYRLEEGLRLTIEWYRNNMKTV